MKTKILLTAFTVISILAASNTFAQYNNHHNNAYNNNGYHEGRGRDRFNDMREIRRDQEKINYDLQQIEITKNEMQWSLYHGYHRKYRKAQFELQRLYSVLARDRFEFAKDCRNARIDERVASRY